MLSRAEFLAKYTLHIANVDRALKANGFNRGIFGMSRDPLADPLADEVGDVACGLADRLIAEAYLMPPAILQTLPKRRRRRRRSRKKPATSASASVAERDAESSAGGSCLPPAAA